MFCKLCTKHTKEGSKEEGGCGHWKPHKTYAEPYKSGYRLYQYSGGLRAAGVRKLYSREIFKDKETANLRAWKIKNNLTAV